MRCPEKQTLNEMSALLHDQPFGLSVQISRDVQTLVRRFRNEGFSFLSKILPLFGKALDRALSGNEPFSLPRMFKTFKGGRLPVFLGAAIRRVFNDAGELLENPCTRTITWLRTFLTYAYKIEVSFDEQNIAEYCDNFRNCDESVGISALSLAAGSGNRLTSIMRAVLSPLEVIRVGKPAFGPGISSNCKRDERYKTFVPPSPMRDHFGREFFHHPNEHALVEGFLPFFLAFTSCFIENSHDPLTWFSYENPVSRVLFVPKDSRGPRVICCEPSHYMYAQKSLQTQMYKFVEDDPIFSGKINFTDQSINRSLTFDTSFATLDLKDASDRISLDIVKRVFPDNLLSDMLACRSSVALLPDNTLVTMNKFAPMGSALCFPVLALVSYACVTSAIYLAGGPIPNRNKDVYVYGDDIIVKNEWAQVAIEGLESIGLLVNRNKSFISSRFRESCGQDTFDTTSVTSLKRRKHNLGLKHLKYRGRLALDDQNGYYANSVSLLNQSRASGFKHLSAALLKEIEAGIGKLPYGVPETPFLCQHVSSTEEAWRYNEASGFSKKGKVRAFAIFDLPLKQKHSEYSRLRHGLLNIDGRNPYDAYKIGARKPILQKRTYRQWYAGAYAPTRT